MIVAGLDISLSSTGIVVADAGPGSFELILNGAVRTKPSQRRADRYDRLDHIASGVMRIVTDAKVEAMAIEGYGFSARTAHAHALAELGGVIRTRLHLAGFQWWEVPPSSLKKFVTAKGNSVKDIVLKDVFKRWGFDTDSNDIADAYGLARMVAASHFGFERKSDEAAWKKVAA